MNPDNESSNGKWKAFATLGWDLSTPQTRDTAATEVVTALRGAVPKGSSVTPPTPSPYGARISTRTPIVGPNGRAGTLISVWQMETDNAPRLITNWLEVHVPKTEKSE